MPPLQRSLRSLTGLGEGAQEVEGLEDVEPEPGGAGAVGVPALWPVPRGAGWDSPSTARRLQGPRPHGTAIPGRCLSSSWDRDEEDIGALQRKEPKWRGSHRLRLAPEALQAP